VGYFGLDRLGALGEDWLWQDGELLKDGVAQAVTVCDIRVDLVRLRMNL
jgi:hypothetical protein